MTDEDELRALLQRYSRAVDDCDFDTIERCFHPEATIEGVRGEQPLADWLDAKRKPSRYATTMHFLGDPLIELESLKMDTYAEQTSRSASATSTRWSATTAGGSSAVASRARCGAADPSPGDQSRRRRTRRPGRAPVGSPRSIVI
jgi:hypothetical protein